MGKGIREFKKSLKEVKTSIEDNSDETPTPRQIDSAPVSSDGEPKKLSE
jgi:Sec-independent protein translocase protein TatA